MYKKNSNKNTKNIRNNKNYRASKNNKSNITNFQIEDRKSRRVSRLKNAQNINTLNRNNQKRTTYTYDNMNIQRYDYLAEDYYQQNNRQYNNQLSKNRKKRIKKKKRNNILIGRLFTLFIFILIISYFSLSIYKSLNKKPIKFETITYGTITNQKTAKGVIIRDEQVYKSNKNGALAFSKNEYEKIKNGEIVATIRDEAAIKDINAELEEINKKILQLQENREELSLFSEDVKKINSQIETVLENGIYELAKNDISAIYELKANVQKKIDIRNGMLLSETNGSVSQLANQRNSKEQKINANSQYISANEGGILSYSIDGLEEKFNFKNLENITAEETKMQSENQNKINEYKIQVLEGEPIFKIVKSNNFYIATNIKTDYVANWKKGDSKKIYIEDNGQYEPQDITIEKIDIGKKDTFILMKCTKNILNYINKRSIIFEINKPKQGFKINNTAIVEKNLLKIPSEYISNNTIIKKYEDGNKKIIISNAEVNETEGVTYVPIEFGNLNTGDTIINPKDNKEFTIKDIYTSKGIYIVNSGSYEFKKINLENSVSNEDFTILDPTFNKNIKIYDRFIPEHKNVLKEELIYN